jgi:hypothetical protein
LGGKSWESDAVPAPARHVELAADRLGVIGDQEGAQTHGCLSL